MNTTQSTTVGMLKLSVSPGHEPDYIRRGAAAIQLLPGVLRVRVDQPANQIEVVFQHPTEGLLRNVHQALREAGSEVVAGKSF